MFSFGGALLGYGNQEGLLWKRGRGCPTSVSGGCPTDSRQLTKTPQKDQGWGERGSGARGVVGAHALPIVTGIIEKIKIKQLANL